MSRLPKDMRDALLGVDEAAENAALDELSAEGALAVLARLRGGRD